MTEVVTWIDPDGVETVLDPDWDVTGRGLPPARLDEFTVPLQPGSVLRSVTDGPRDHTWTLWLQAATTAELWTQQRALLRAMDPERGQGRLRVLTPAGDTREIGCVLVEGGGLTEKLGETSGPQAQQVKVTLRSHRPYWSDPYPTPGGPWGPDENATPFFPIFPLHLVASEVFRQVTIDNDADVPAWPIWTIHGPGSDIGLKNLTTGKQLLLPGSTLGPGEVLTIDTRPGVKTVLSGSGASFWSYVSGASSLWPLIQGSNDISVEMGASVLGSSSTSLQFYREYKSL